MYLSPFLLYPLFFSRVYRTGVSEAGDGVTGKGDKYIFVQDKCTYPLFVLRVNRAQPAKDEALVRLSIQRGRLLGSPRWQERVAKTLRLTNTFRGRGGPRKSTAASGK
jgi:hypothetical protein